MATAKKKNWHNSPDGPRVCDTTPENCPITKKTGEAHYASAEEAQKAYDERMSGKHPMGASKSSEMAVDDGYARTRFVIPAENHAKLLKALDKVNGRLARAGIEERFEADVTSRMVSETKDFNGIERTVAYEVYDVELNEPKISYGGYEFEAVLNREEKGFITRVRKGVELNGWQPEKMTCEHCGHNRARAKTYLIKDEDGVRHQIGSTCVEAYLGMKPEGLWALESDEMQKLAGGGGGGGITHYRTDETLAYALAVSNGGEQFIPSSYSSANPTAQQVSEAMHGGQYVDENWRREMHEKAAEYSGSKELKDLKARIEALSSDTDYGRNLKTVAEGEYSSIRNRALLVSAVSLIAREKRAERKAEEKVQYSPGFFGQVNEKVAKGTKMKLVKSKPYTTQDFHGYDIEKYAVTMMDEDGKQVVFFSARDPEPDEDGNITISSGVVAKQENKYDQDQTVLSRVRLVKK